MGVRGLKSFIEKNDDLLIKEYRLYETFIIIDACNLIGALIKQSQRDERSDLFGGNMVQFGEFVSRFFENLKKCNIRPILVFDGAQTRDINKSKTREKQRRAIERFQNVMSINKFGFGDFILPATATNVFRSIIIDKKLEIIQCMYEADAEIARLARTFKCPVVSNDSDFYLIDLPGGLIPIDLLDHQHILQAGKTNSEESSETRFNFMCCSMYRQSNLLTYFPNLDKSSLPLLGILAGNDFVQSKMFDKICSQLPSQRIYESCGLRGKQFRKVTSKQHEKILKILYYLCDRSLNENINRICTKVSRNERQKLKNLINSNLLVYDVPTKDDFKEELEKLYQKGFYKTYGKSFRSKSEADLSFRETMEMIMFWLKNAMEKSVLSYRCLELAHRNILFLQSHMDDPQLPSAHLCQMTCFGVLLRLLRSSESDGRPCIMYDRVTGNYDKCFVYPIEYLENYGELNQLIYDIPIMREDDRRRILLATFSSSDEEFSQNVVEYYNWFNDFHAEEFLTIKILMKFIENDCNSGRIKLWKQFKQATLICMIYNYIKKNRDSTLRSRLDTDYQDFFHDMINQLETNKLTRTPMLGKKRLYNCRIMHQITQLQTSIISFNFLNAFLGDIMTRIRSEEWLNSCLIYNLAEILRKQRLSFSSVPYIIHGVL